MTQFVGSIARVLGGIFARPTPEEQVRDYMFRAKQGRPYQRLQMYNAALNIAQQHNLVSDEAEFQRQYGTI